MEVSNNSQRRLLYAFERGYYVAPNGVLYSPKGKKLKLKPIHTSNRLGFSVNCASANVSGVVPVHRLHAYQKYGDAIFEDGVEVRHKDGDFTNNTFGNLLLGTHSDNMMDKPKSVRMKASLAGAKKITKNAKIAVFVRFLRGLGLTYHAIGERFGISDSQVYYILYKAKTY